jgi:hypothetical protein
MSTVFQAGEVKRVGNRRREIPRRRELQLNSSDVGRSVISNDLKGRADDA